MDAEIHNNYIKFEKLICALFNDTGFSGFTFHTSFGLRFSRNKETKYNGFVLPMEFEVNILSKWWFGSKDEWENKVKQLTSNRDLVEPEEPVIAYELACLRWSNGSEVEKALFIDNTMQIKFKSGTSIYISSENDMDYSWIISERNNIRKTDVWSIVCENNDFFVYSDDKRLEMLIQ